MAKELRIRLDESPSKEEEIDALEKIWDFFHHKMGKGSTYLESLFTEDLVSWVSIKIKNDIGPDIYEWFNGAVQDRGLDTSRANRLEDELKCLVESRDITVKDLHVQVDARTMTCDAFRNEIDVKDADIDRLMEEANVHIDHAAGLEMDIRNLKAKLYDLISKEA